MNKSFAAIALGCALCCAPLASFAGSTAPEMGAPPSQTGTDPRTQGSDPSRQGTSMDPATSEMGIRSGIGAGTTDSMGTSTSGDKLKRDADLPGGDVSGSGSTGNSPNSSTKGAPTKSSAGGVGG